MNANRIIQSHGLSTTSHLRIALVIPCYNEESTVGRVVDEFRLMLPAIQCHVFDNNSTDQTVSVALRHGATVHPVRLQGKGNVVRRMFADVEADIYVMVDGDATYDATGLPGHIEQMLAQQADMLLGARVDDLDAAGEQYRRGHRLGNRLLTGTTMWIFGGAFSDMLSGYRLFSRRFAKSFAAHAHGFETETELTVHALELRMPSLELPVAYRARPEGSMSKLSTYKDGLRILRTIVRLILTERPLLLFCGVALVLTVVSLVIGTPIVLTFMETGLVPRLPTALLATGLMLSALLSTVCGILLDQVTVARREAKHLRYLTIPALSKMSSDCD